MILPYMDMAAILFNGAEPFELIDNTLLTEGPHVKSGENCSSGLKEDISKLHNFIDVYCPGARADNHQGTKFWLWLQCFTTLITHC